MSRKFNRPRLMKTILKLGYGEMDKYLPISDQAFFVKEDNLEKAEKIIWISSSACPQQKSINFIKVL